ncbi:MAG: phosphoribosyltransferase family protein, partial [Paracoccaceae bacterium]
GVRKTIEGLHTSESLRRMNVVLIDDVTTTGGSVLSTLEALKLEGANVLKIVSIVDRNEGAREAFLENGLEFESVFEARDFHC